MRLLTIPVVALSVLLSSEMAEAGNSYPLFAGSVREVGPVHKDIDQLRKDREGGFTLAMDAQKEVAKMCSVCTSDTYLLIDQPGIRVDDFQTLITHNHIPQWTELRKFSERCKTIASFPRLDGPVDLDKLERTIRKKCNSETIHANPRAEKMFENYEDTKTRVIRMEFDPLPDDELEREIVLRLNDEKILEAFRLTPSPYFTIIYTSTEGEEYVPTDPGFKKQKYLDIFADLARAKRDATDPIEVERPLKQKRKKTPPSNLSPQREPPFAQKKKKDERAKRRREMEAEKFLTKETVGTIMVCSAGLGLAYALLCMLNKFKSYFKSADSDESGEPDESDEKQKPLAAKPKNE